MKKIENFNMIRAFVFDLDGLMVFTEELALESWHQLLKGFETRMELNDLYTLIGVDSSTSGRYIAEATGITLSPREVAKAHHEILLGLINENLEPAPGLKSLIDQLASSSYPLAVASNSPRVYVERVLQATRLRKMFRCVISRDEVIHGKPAPDLYLEAAACLGAVPECCHP
jgi:HAD superfamily hydrolase (TIGR01509 family)